MGGKRKPEQEKMGKLFINVKNKYLLEMEKEGKPKHVVERLIREKYAYLEDENVDRKIVD